jgi:ABC-type multidrug transport system ATPase subunit
MLDLAPKCSQIAGMAPGARELLVAVHNLSKRYSRTTAVADVTLALRAGEIWGFIGANGAGKTTILRMLAGILKPDGGGGQVLGFDLRRDTAAIRERVGYMSQRLSLYPELSVFENLRFRAAIYGLRNPRAATEAAMLEFGLVPWVQSAACSLSGGWARRLQLAASLLHSPRLVLLDEPTAGLDAAARQEVWRRVERLAAAGAGVIVCTHDLVEAERCSHAALFANGQVVAAGAPAEIAAGARVAVFLLCGTGVRRLAKDVSAVAGVLASSPEGESLRVVAYPLAEPDLRRFAATRAASLAPVGPRLEDAVLARSVPMSRQQT